MRTRNLVLSIVVILGILALGCNTITQGIQFNQRGDRVVGSGVMAEEQRSISDFDKIQLIGFGDIQFQQSNDLSLQISAEDNILPQLVTEVRGKTLVLSIEPNVNLSPNKPVEYYLSGPDLESVSLSGSGSFNSDLLEVDQFSVDIVGSGSGNIDSMIADLLEVRIAGSGSVSIGDGKVQEQKINITGSGRHSAENVPSLKVDARIPGSGSIIVWVEDELDVLINGSGTVSYYGNPENVSKNITGSGSVNSLGEK